MDRDDTPSPTADGGGAAEGERFDQSTMKPSAPAMRKRNAAQTDDGAEEVELSASARMTRLLRQADVFPKPEEDIVEKTSSGAAVSMLSLAIIAVLFLSEFVRYMSVHTREHIGVDTTTGATLPINFNITFHSLRCSQCRMDVMDVSGDQQVNVRQKIHKQRLSASGALIGPPTLDVRDGMIVVGDEGLNEGCRLYGQLQVNRVAGNVHVALGASHGRGPHASQQHIHQFMMADLNSFNASHTINHLSFGDHYAGDPRPNALDGVTRVTPQPAVATSTSTTASTGVASAIGVRAPAATAGGRMAHFQYFLKIVPTRYVDGNRGGAVLANSFQYSVTEHVHELQPATSEADMDTHKIPGLFLIYDLSAFMIRVESYSVPFSSFFTSVCAIVGGVLTVAGIVDSLLYRAPATIARVSAATGVGVAAASLIKLTAAKAGPSNARRTV